MMKSVRAMAFRNSPTSEKNWLQSVENDLGTEMSLRPFASSPGDIGIDAAAEASFMEHPNTDPYVLLNQFGVSLKQHRRI